MFKFPQRLILVILASLSCHLSPSTVVAAKPIKESKNQAQVSTVIRVEREAQDPKEPLDKTQRDMEEEREKGKRIEILP